MRLPSHEIRFDLADSFPAGCYRDNADRVMIVSVPPPKLAPDPR
jgi:hypothetical protein